MFDEFEAGTIATARAPIFVRRGGSGPPLLLLHGFPQTHPMWRDVAALLVPDFTVVCADLPGYGQSGCPPSDAAHAAYSKRCMARDMVEVMAALGCERFCIAGHTAVAESPIGRRWTRCSMCSPSTSCGRGRTPGWRWGSGPSRCLPNPNRFPSVCWARRPTP
jgi:hypothetical protein